MKRNILLTTMILQKVETLLIRSARYFRLVIVAALILLVSVETAEFGFGISDAFHLGEIMIYVLLLGTMGILIQVILRAHEKQQQSIKLLTYKHKLGLELLTYKNWDSLTILLTKQLAEIMHAKAAYLFFNRSLSDGSELVAEWVECDSYSHASFKGECLICARNNSIDKLRPHYSDLSAEPDAVQNIQSFCYPIFYKDDLYAMFRFILETGQLISEEEQEVLASVSDEVVISLVAGQDRKRLSDLELTETALAERHAMSHYLHDNLGQNLGYLRMKLEQFVNQPTLLQRNGELDAELIRMKDIADESYRFVRNKLEVSIPDSTPLLTNYLQEHARKVAVRSNLKIEFSHEGTAKAVPIELQQAVFFVFQEALANVEKHANACKVDVLIHWETDHLSITVNDDGKGFDISNVAAHKHFGLEIMRERMFGIGGSVEIVSSENSGTSVLILAPIPVGKKQGKVSHG